ncbi:hypothetical protein ACXWN6_10080, partial [Streptococcus pyogenes]
VNPLLRLLIFGNDAGMFRSRILAPALLALATSGQAAPAADVLHWWTSPGETAAMHALADAYRAAGGSWRYLAVTASDQAR